nr:hypothetical protein [uncultured bacterium]
MLSLSTIIYSNAISVSPAGEGGLVAFFPEGLSNAVAGGGSLRRTSKFLPAKFPVKIQITVSPRRPIGAAINPSAVCVTSISMDAIGLLLFMVQAGSE